VERVAGIEPA